MFLPISYILYLSMPIQLFLPLYTYYMAVSQHQEPPFPQSTITATASHYPQDVFFRFGFLINAGSMALLFWSINLVLHDIKKKINYPGPISGWTTKTGLVMTLCYTLTIGTIDSGQRGPIHSINAVIFFVMLLVSMVSTTLTLKKLKAWNTNAIGEKSWLWKKISCGVVLCTWVVQMLCQVSGHLMKDDNNVDIVEWVSNYGALLWMSSFYCEFRWLEMSVCSDEQHNSALMNL